MIKKLFNKESSTVCPKKRTTYFQTAVTPIKIDEITKALSSKMTQCQNILLKNIVDKSKLFLQMVLMGQL